jgi:hypothetical protein
MPWARGSLSQGSPPSGWGKVIQDKGAAQRSSIGGMIVTGASGARSGAWEQLGP